LDEHLGDQILMPEALLAAGKLGASSPGTTRYTTARVTEHLTTHAWLIEHFLPVRVTVEPGGAVEVASIQAPDSSP
jgi:RNA 3'-terminal phosphate cyclase (ATP)